jgi:hypothetical protein
MDGQSEARQIGNGSVGMGLNTAFSGPGVNEKYCSAPCLSELLACSAAWAFCDTPYWHDASFSRKTRENHHFRTRPPLQVAGFQGVLPWHQLCSFIKRSSCMATRGRLMRTLLRRASTGLYFAGPDRWTADPAKARDFRSIDRAVSFVESWSLTDVELAFAFNDSGEVTGVPVEKVAMGYSQD